MTNDEIRVMEPGPEMNALVGEMVFGQTKWCEEDMDDALCTCDLSKPGTIHFRTSLPKFSTDWSLAGEIMEEMQGEGYMVELESNSPHKGQWTAMFLIIDKSCGRAWSSTGPAAISKAALLAVNNA